MFSTFPAFTFSSLETAAICKIGAAFAVTTGFSAFAVFGLAATVAVTFVTGFTSSFAAIGIIGAVRVITHPRPVFAAIYFVLTVLAAAGIFLMLQAEFLAFALIVLSVLVFVKGLGQPFPLWPSFLG